MSHLFTVAATTLLIFGIVEVFYPGRRRIGALLLAAGMVSTAAMLWAISVR